MESGAKFARVRGPSPRWVFASGAFAAFLVAGAAARADGPVVDVSVRSPGLPELQARAPGDAWERVCVPPCSRRLDVALDYRVAGEGLVDSDVFRLPPAAPHVRVDVSAGSPMLRAIGTIFIIGGVLFGVGGGTILVLPDDGPRSGDKNVVGAGFVVGGLLLGAVGVVARVFAETHLAVTPVADAP
jgi:hypothetical protein